MRFGLSCQSIHNSIDVKDPIAPFHPLPKGGILLFDKEGLGEISEDDAWPIMYSRLLVSINPKPGYRDDR
jgi:hypothetical protein